jgi:hypothetical protein
MGFISLITVKKLWKVIKWLIGLDETVRFASANANFSGPEFEHDDAVLQSFNTFKRSKYPVRYRIRRRRVERTIGDSARHPGPMNCAIIVNVKPDDHPTLASMRPGPRRIFGDLCLHGGQIRTATILRSDQALHIGWIGIAVARNKRAAFGRKLLRQTDTRQAGTGREAQQKKKTDKSHGSPS